jgi:hypothetical protein
LQSLILIAPAFKVHIRRKGDKSGPKLEEAKMVMGTPLHSIRSVTSDLPASPVSLGTAHPAESLQVRIMFFYTYTSMFD